MWRAVAVTCWELRLRKRRRWLSAVNSRRPNSRVDRSARSSVDVNLECYARARSRERSADKIEEKAYVVGA